MPDADARALAAIALVPEPDPERLAEDHLHDLVGALAAGLGAGATALVAARAEYAQPLELRATVGLAPEERARLEAAAATAPAELAAATAAVAGALGRPGAAEWPLRAQGREVGILVVAPGQGGVALEPGSAAVRLCAERLGASLEREALHHSLERAMAQILESDERMLGRIGLDIHDGPTQQLSVALLEVQLLEADLEEAQRNGVPMPESLRPSMGRIYETVGGALHEMRELIGYLRPAQFENRTLPEILADAITAFEARSGAEVEITREGEFPRNGISITQRITFYRILQEALTNAHRHGQAAHCRVRLMQRPGGIALRVEDDGCGFEVEQAFRPRSGQPVARFGIHGMRDRAELLGGTFAIVSHRDRGTTVEVFLPRWRAGPEATDADGV